MSPDESDQLEDNRLRRWRMVVGTAVMGKAEENLGDSLDGLETDLADNVIFDHLSSPLTDPHAILGRATTRLVYDLFAYHRTKELPEAQPGVVYTLSRETHDADLESGGPRPALGDARPLMHRPAGLTDRLREMADILALLEGQGTAEAPKTRGPDMPRQPKATR